MSPAFRRKANTAGVWILLALMSVWHSAPGYDLSGDGHIDCNDLELFRQAFGTAQGSPEYRADADLNSDGIIDGRDLILFLNDFPPHLGCHPLLDPDRFVPLDASGTPIEGLFVQILPNGALAPFEFRPGGRQLNGLGQGLNIRLPDGASVVQSGGQPHISFSTATADFGNDSPVHFPQTLARAGGPSAQLPIAANSVTVSNLAAAFNLNVSNGIPVKLVGRVPALWRGGTLTDTGILGARLLPDLPGLPVPTGLVEYAEFEMRPDARGDLLIPLVGEFALPDKSGAPPKFQASPQQPLWLKLRRDGNIGLTGRLDVNLEGGARFRADVLMDDPWYRFSIFADGIHMGLASNLVSLLPTPASNCLTGINTNAPSQASLDLATECLDAFHRSYHLFSAATVGGAPANGATNVPARPPEPIDLGLAMLEAWAYSFATPAAQTINVQTIEPILHQLARSASASGDARGIAAHRAALMRAAQSAYRRGANLSRIEDAIAEVEAALVERAQDPDALNSLDAAAEMLELLAEAEGIRQEIGLPGNPAWIEAGGAILNRFAVRHTRDLGVLPTVFSPAANPRINSMNRFEAAQQVRDAMVIKGELAALGLDGDLEAPLDELIGQTALRMFHTVTAALDDAEARNDPVAFSYAFEDLLDLMASQALTIFPNVPELDVIPSTNEVEPYVDRLGVLLQADLNRPLGERSIGNIAAEVARLLRIVRGVPPGITFADTPFLRAHARLETALAQAFTGIASETRASVLADLIEAGIHHDALAAQFSIPVTIDWTTSRLPQAVARLASVAPGQKAWHELGRAVEHMLEEADRLGEVGEQNKRLRYLNAVAALLTASRATAVALWNDEETRRGTDPALNAADMFLPGDILITGVRGALEYNRRTSFFSGAFGGRLRLPKYGFDLAVNNASIRSGGAFDLNAYGQLAIPFEQPFATLAVLPRKPLHLRYNPASGIALSGSGRVQFSNGLTFEGFLTLEDPVYAFGISAEGLKFQLAKELTLVKPVINQGNVMAIAGEAQGELTRYYRRLNAAFEPIVLVATNLPTVSTNDFGVPPKWTEAPTAVFRFADVAAWANGASRHITPFVNTPYSNSVTALTNSLDQFINEVSTLEQTLGTELDLLEDQIRRIEAEREWTAGLSDAVDQQILGNNDQSKLLELTTRMVTENRKRAQALVTPGLTNDLRRTLAVIQLLLQNAANEQVGSVTVSGSNVLNNAETLFLSGQLLADSRTQYFHSLGLDPVTGAVADTHRLHALSELELAAATTVLQDLEAAAFLANVDGQNLLTALDSVLNRRADLLTAELATFDPASDPARAIEINSELERIFNFLVGFELEDDTRRRQVASNQIALLDTHFDTDDEIAALEKNLNRLQRERKEREQTLTDYALNRGDGGIDLTSGLSTNALGFWDNLLAVIEQLQLDLPPGLDLKFNDYIRYRINQIKSSTVSPNFLKGRLENGRDLLRTTLDLGVWAQARMPGDAVLMEDISITLSNLTHEFTLVGEAAYAWWEISRYTDLLLAASARYGDQMNATVGTALKRAVADSILAARNISDIFSAVLQTVELEEVVFKLPGDLHVEKVFGGMTYNRETAFLEGRFGGTFALPEIEARFTIEEARLNNEGGFALSTSLGTPLPFDGVSLSLALQATGSVSQLISVAGVGTLDVDGQMYSVAAGYDFTNHVLSVGTLLTNLDLRFTDDFVLFDAGLGFEVSTVVPQGRLLAGGSAGMFARDPLPPGDVDRSHFHLAANGVAAVFNFNTNGFSAALESGQFRLPEFFTAGLCETGSAITNGPTITLSPANKIQVAYTNTPQPQVHFSGSFQFDNFGFEMPGFTGLAVEVCSVILDFDGRNLPVMSNLNGRVQVPLGTETAKFEVVNAAWDLQGFPVGTVSLTTNVTIFDAEDFTVTLLGANPGGCPFSGFSVTNDTNNIPTFRLGGGMRLSLPVDVVYDEVQVDGVVSASSCGSVRWTPGARPEFELNTLTIGPSTLRLGGVGGFAVSNAVLEVQQAQNLFNLGTNTPFIIAMSGSVHIPSGPSFGLQNARFTFTEPALPKFTVQGLSIGLPEMDLVDSLQINVSQASIEFENDTLPLPGLLAPTNVTLGLTASLVIGVDPVQITGIIEDLKASIDANGEFTVSADGVGAGIGPLPLGPLILNGQVYLSGLTDPNGWFFAGRLAGQMVGQNTRLAVLLAFNQSGPIGVCVDTDFGPSGIPIYAGFMLTGITGGLSFMGVSGDPCDFTSYVRVDTNGVPISTGGDAPAMSAMMSWDEVAEYQTYYEREQEVQALSSRMESEPALAASLPMGTPPASQSDEFPCPSGDCPPPTVGILCQPHPDEELHPNRIIYKFTSLPEEFVNGLGITESFFTGLNTPSEIAEAVSSNLHAALSSILPVPDPDLLGALYDDVFEFYTNSMHELHVGLSNTIHQAAADALGSGTQTVYQAIIDAAYAGVPCPKVTLKLAGTFSYTGISTFLSATVGAVVSTDITGQFADSAGLVGQINLVGIPVGQAKLFFAYTDASGNPNPSMCGDVTVALGPLEFGNLGIAFECPDCITGIAASIFDLFLCLGEQLVEDILLITSPERVGLPLAQLAAEMTEEEIVFFLAELLASDALQSAGNVAACFFAALQASWDSIQPTVSMCGSVGPKLFGLPLGEDLYAIEYFASKTNMIYNVGFSPQYLIGYYFGASMFPPMDQATLGMGFTYPDPIDAMLGALNGRFATPEAAGAYAVEMFSTFLADATYTIGYEFSPFGLKMFNAEARLIMPNLVDHPVGRIPAWTPPENQAYPSRLDLLLSSIAEDKLADPGWKGNAGDLYQAFPEGSPEREAVQMAGLSFADHYFPHGGFVGGARLTLPPALTDAPPDVFYTMLNPSNAPLDRLIAAADYIGNYVLDFSVEAGNLAFYIPAPNPPSLTNSQGEPLNVIELMESIQQFDISNLGIGEFYPMGALFVRGYIDANLIGIPLGSGEMIGVPASGDTGGYFRITGRVPTNSWLNGFMQSAELLFEVRESPPRTIEDQFNDLYIITTNAIATTNLMVLNDVLDSFAQDLPKIAMELSVTNLSVPPELTNMIRAAGASAALFAYSPRYEPEFSGAGPVANVRREGGIAFRGNFSIADFVNIDNLELAVVPHPVLPPRLLGLADIPLLSLPGGLQIWDASIEFDTEPGVGQPFFYTEGAMAPFQLGSASLIPLSGTNLYGRLGIVNSGGLPDIDLQIDPARIDMGFLAPGINILVHGATTNDAFTFSTEGSWNSTVTVIGDLTILEPGTTNPLLRVNATQNLTAQINGTGTTYAAIALELPTGISVTAFPNTPYAQTMTLDPAGGNPVRLSVATDGSFSLEAELQGGISIPGTSIQNVSAGAALRITNGTMQLTGFFDGGLLGNLHDGGGALAEGTLTRFADGSYSLNASATLPPLEYGVFRVAGIGGGNLNATLDEDGLAIPSGAQLEIRNVAEDLLTLQPFSFQANGAFDIAVSAGDLFITNVLSATGGAMSLSRSDVGVVRFAMQGQQITLAPDTQFATPIPSLVSNLVIESTGRFLYDSGTQTNIGLPGLMTVGGRLELGYQPDPSQPGMTLSVASPLSMGSIAVGSLTSRVVTVTNPGGATLYLSLYSPNPQVFPVTPTALTVPAGQSRTFTVSFAPVLAGATNAVLQFTKNTASGPSTLQVTGTGVGVPKFYQSHTTLNFGSTIAGGTARANLTIANIGSQSLTVNSAATASPFAVLTGATGALAPGSNRVVTIDFTPAATGAYTGQLLFNTTPTGVHTVHLAGAATGERWYTQHEASGPIRDLQMLDTERGVAVGDSGLFLETWNGGRAWASRRATSFGLNTVQLQPAAATNALLHLHFEEPPGAAYFEDSSGNGRHFTIGGGAPTSGGRGQYGAGMAFNGSTDHLTGPDFTPGNEMSVSLWVNPASTADNQAFVSKSTAIGSTLYYFGFFNNGYRIRLRGSTQTYAIGDKQTGWQHLVHTITDQGTNRLHKVYRNGVLLGAFERDAAIGNLAGKGWSLGQLWANASTPANFYNGQMDEVMMFNRVLNSNEVAQLAQNPPRSIIAGNSGHAYQSFDSGRTWQQVAHTNVLLGGGATWNAVSLTPGGSILLAGSRSSPSGGYMVFGAGDNWVEVYPAGASAPNAIRGLSPFQSASLFNPVALAVGDNGLVLRTSGGFSGAVWAQVTNGLPALAGITNNAVDLAPNGVALIVGTVGTILRSADYGLTWSSVPSPTTQILYDVRIRGTNAFAVGNSGHFLRSTDSGQSWVLTGEEPLGGSLRALGAAGPVGQEALWTGRGTAPYVVRHRPHLEPTGPIAVFSSGRMDFGRVNAGDVSKRPLQIFNRGDSDLVISDITSSLATFAAGAALPLTIPPGGVRQIFVSYAPVAASASDIGVLLFAGNDPQGPFRIDVRGSSSTLVWQEIGLPTSKLVIDVDFPSAAVGYAITETEVFKTTDGGTTWQTLSGLGVAANGRLTAVEFGTTNLGWVVGGRNLSSSCGETDCRSIIRKTLDGGATWLVQTSGYPNVVNDIVVPEADITYPIVSLARRTDIPTTDGDVLISFGTGGSSWLNFGPPAGVVQFNPRALHFDPTGVVVVAHGNQLYHRTIFGAWSEGVRGSGAELINDIHFPAFGVGFIVGTEGFYRYTHTGPAAGNWQTSDDAGVLSRHFLRSVHFASTNTGWITADGIFGSPGGKIFRSDTGGRRFYLDYDGGSGASFRAIKSFTTNVAWVVGQRLGQGGRIWRLAPADIPDRGTLAAPDQLDFGNADLGGSATRSVVLRNIGAQPLNIHRIALEGGADESSFRWTSAMPASIASGGQAQISMEFQPRRAGPHTAILRVLSDSAEGEHEVVLSANVVDVPHILRVNTQPAGLDVIVNRARRAAPLALSLVSATNAPDQYLEGASVPFAAPLTQTVNGVTYLFSGWNQPWNSAYTAQLSRALGDITAYYVLQDAPEVGVGASPPMGGDPPDPFAGAPTGPFIRLSDASLNVPRLGGFAVQGELYMSGTEFQATLSRGAVVLPGTNTVNLLEIGPASWDIHYLRNSHFRLRTQSPSLKVLHKPVTPSAQLTLNFAESGAFTAGFNTLDDLYLLPGVLEFGPAAMSLHVDTFFQLNATGAVRALNLPDGTWAMNQSTVFQAQDGPFSYTLPIPNPLIDLGFFRLQNGSVRVQRANNGVFSLSVTNFQPVLFNQALGTASGSVGSNGRLTMTGVLPNADIALAPSTFSLRRLSSTNTLAFDLNIPAQSLAMGLPSVRVKSSTAGWPAAGVTTPGITFNFDGTFDTGKRALPAFTFDGIGITGGGTLNQNYIRLRRDADGVMELNLRDRRDFLAGEMDLALDLNTSGTVNGSFAGTVAFDFPPLGLTDVTLANLSMGYTSGSSCQFQGTATALGFTWQTYFGSSCAGVCTSWCGPTLIPPDFWDCTTLSGCAGTGVPP